MKKIILGLIGLLLYFAISAQEEPIYLKYRFVKRNGTSIIGQIVEKNLDGPYTIKLDNGTLINVKEQEILRFYPLKAKKNSLNYSSPGYRWGLSTEIMGVNNGQWNIGTTKVSTGVSMAGHYYINSQIALGAGVGMYNYDLNARRLILPLFGEARWRMIKNYSSPLISLKIGHGLAAKNYLTGLVDKKGGLFINPFFGYEFGTARKLGWVIGVGVLLQKAYYGYMEGSTFVDEDIYFRRTEFKLGINLH
ncbi:MAG: hypothetical protein IPO25_21230 [Saprospiraceae bacterium]|nr:hypothetical protein [Saprospiraceae bacterium]